MPGHQALLNHIAFQCGVFAARDETEWAQDVLRHLAHFILHPGAPGLVHARLGGGHALRRNTDAQALEHVTHFNTRGEAPHLAACRGVIAQRALAIELRLLEIVEHRIEAACMLRGGDDGEALVVQRLHQVVKALVFLAHQPVLGDFHLVQKEHVGALCGGAAHAVHGMHADTRRIGIHDQQADALVFGRCRVGAHSHPVPTRKVCRGDEYLVAAHLVVITPVDGARLQAADVGAGAGLGIGNGPLALVAKDLRQEFLLHAFTGFVENGVGDSAHVFTHGGRVHPFEFGIEDELRQGERPGRAAVLLGEPHAQPALCRQLVDKGDAFGGVHEHAATHRVCQLLSQKSLNFLSERGLFAGPVELHVCLQ